MTASGGQPGSASGPGGLDWHPSAHLDRFPGAPNTSYKLGNGVRGALRPDSEFAAPGCKNHPRSDPTQTAKQLASSPFPHPKHAIAHSLSLSRGGQRGSGKAQTQVQTLLNGEGCVGAKSVCKKRAGAWSPRVCGESPPGPQHSPVLLGALPAHPSSLDRKWGHI